MGPPQSRTGGVVTVLRFVAAWCALSIVTAAAWSATAAAFKRSSPAGVASLGGVVSGRNEPAPPAVTADTTGGPGGGAAYAAARSAHDLPCP